MHILFLTDNFPPEVNAPATRTYEHCREWVKAGHQVTVVTCAPNFPIGRVFEGYRNRLRQTEPMDGINVIRVWSYITPNEGFLKRTLDYASFMVSATIASPFVRSIDVVIATSPQFFTACAGYLVSRIIRRPFVFELRDLWPASIRAVGAMQEGHVLRTLEKTELFLYRKAAHIVAVTNAFREDLISRGIDGNKMSVVTNGADLDQFFPRSKDRILIEELGLAGKFVAGYVGTLGMAHHLETLVEAAEKIELSTDRDWFRLLFLGNGAARAKLEELVRTKGLKSIVFLDTVPREEVARYWSILDVSIIHLRRNDVFKTVIPSKLFECMALGIPVLHGVEGESAEIVEAERVGLTFEPENANALREGIMAFANDAPRLKAMAKSGIQASQRYDRKELAARLLLILSNVTGGMATAVEAA